MRKQRGAMACCQCCNLLVLTLFTIAILAFAIGCILYIEAQTLTVHVQDVKFSSLNITQAPQQGYMLASADVQPTVRISNPSPRTRRVDYKQVNIDVLYAGIPLAHGPLFSSPFSDNPHVSIAFFYPHLSVSNVLLPADAALALNASQRATPDHTDSSLIKLDFYIQASIQVTIRKVVTIPGMSVFACKLYLRAPIVMVGTGDTSTSSRLVQRHCKTLHTFVTDHHSMGY